MKLCIDCQHHKAEGNQQVVSHWCARDVNPVDGMPFDKPCQTERFSRDEGACGLEARFWIHAYPVDAHTH